MDGKGSQHKGNTPTDARLTKLLFSRHKVDFATYRFNHADDSQASTRMVTFSRLKYNNMYGLRYVEVAMFKLRADEDIRPLSEFRAGVASFVKHVHETRRPMVLTQRGRGVAVLMDVREFELIQERLEILEDIYRAEEQLVAGEGVAHGEAKARVLKGIAR